VKAKEYAEKYAPRFTDKESAMQAFTEMQEELLREMKDIAISRNQDPSLMPYSLLVEMANKSEAIAKHINKMAPGGLVYMDIDWFSRNPVVKDLKEYIANQNRMSRAISEGRDATEAINALKAYVKGQVMSQKAVPIMGEATIGYSSHGCLSTWAKIKELEIMERGNYSEKEVAAWESKYGLTDLTFVIWVAIKKNIAVAYDAWADDYYAILGLDDEGLKEYMLANDVDEPVQFDLSKGRIITESDDGDYGFLFIPDCK